MDKGYSYIEQAAFKALDVKADTLIGVAVVTEGESKGHGTYVGPSFVDDLIKLGNAAPGGIKSSFGHPEMCTDPIGTELGRFTNFRRDGNRAIADITFIRTPFNTKQIDHILTFAIADPNILGTSIRFMRGQMINEDGTPYDPEIGGQMFETITELIADDFVSDPAANPGLFSQTGKERSIRAFKNMMSIPEVGGAIKDLINDTAMALFNKKQTKPQSNWVAAFAIQRQAGATEFGEMVLDDNNFFVYPGEVPAVGDPVTIRDAAGVESEAPDGDHTTQDGWVFTTMGGIITAIAEPAPAEPNAEPAQAPAFSALQSENAQLKAQLALHEKAFAHRKEPKPEPMKQPTRDFRPDDAGNYDKKGKPKEEFVAQMLTCMMEEGVMSAGGKKTKNFKISRKSEHAQFSTGFDFSNTIARQFDIYSDVIYQTLATDSILSRFNRVNDKIYRGGRPQYDTKIPLADYQAAYGQRLWEAKNVDCDVDPRGLIVLSEREINSVPIQYDIEFCPVQARYVWDGLIYQGTDVVPMEAIVFAIIANRLAQDLDDLVMFGRGKATAASRNVVGLLAQIQNGVLSGNIPALQSISQAAYSELTALAQIENLCNAIPDEMLAYAQLQLFCSMQIKRDYYKNYRSAYPDRQIIARDEYGMVQDFFETDVLFNDLFVLGRDNDPTTGTKTHTAFITQPNNIFYLMEVPADEGSVTVESLPGTRGKILITHTNYFGINYALGTEIVTNITTLDPRIFTPNIL